MGTADVLQHELLLTTDAESPSWSTAAWDPATGAQVVVFRGGRASAGTLSVLGGHTLVAGERGRPGLQLWRLARRDAVHQRLSTAGAVGALAVDPSATWCVTAVAERLFVHHLASGQLLAVLGRHYQPVTRLAFTDDGSHFVSAGDDGLAVAWPLAACADQHMPDASQPLHVWSDHALAVTGLHVGGGAVGARVYTCSRDQTCKVYQLATGELLLSVCLEAGLTALVVDRAESVLLVGTSGGAVVMVALVEPPRSLDRHVPAQAAVTLTGHAGRVTCLAVTHDGAMLASGSDDATVRLWHVPSRQCVRTLPHRGAVTNVLLTGWPAALRTAHAAVAPPPPPPLQVAPLQRQSGQQDAPLELELIITNQSGSRPEDADERVEEHADVVSQLRRQVTACEDVNSTMYEFMVNKLMAEV